MYCTKAQYFGTILFCRNFLQENFTWTECMDRIMVSFITCSNWYKAKSKCVFLQTCTILNLLFKCQRLIAIFYVSSPWCRMYNNFLREGTPKLFWTTLIFVITRYHCRHIRRQSEAIRRCREYLWRKEIKFSIFFQALLVKFHNI